MCFPSLLHKILEGQKEELHWTEKNFKLNITSLNWTETEFFSFILSRGKKRQKFLMEKKKKKVLK